MIKRFRLLGIYGLYFRGSSRLGDVKSGRWLFTFRRTVIIGISEEPSAGTLRLHIKVADCALPITFRRTLKLKEIILTSIHVC
jgi:hypothetical protein